MNVEKFKEDLKASNLCDLNLSQISLDDLVNVYNTELSSLMNKHCPLIVKKLSCRKKDVWFDVELKELLSQCRACERKWRKSKLHSDKEKYQEACKIYDLALKQKRQTHHSQSLSSSKDNKGQLFSKINSLLGKETSILPDNKQTNKQRITYIAPRNSLPVIYRP